MLHIRPAVQADLPALQMLDRHISAQHMERLVRNGTILTAEADGVICGILRWGLFWDEIPFMNLLFLEEKYRGHGIGRALVTHWESAMKAAGYSLVLTSTQANEHAQHFYRHLGYKDIGGFTLPENPLELILLHSFS